MFLRWLRSLRPSSFVFWAICLLYLFLYVFNPETKFAFVAYLALAAAVWAKTEDVALGLTVSLIAALPVATGKTYRFEIIPPGILPWDRWPDGFLLDVTLTHKHVLSMLLAGDLFLHRQALKSVRLRWEDACITGYFFLNLATSLVSPMNAAISFLIALGSLNLLILYITLRIHAASWKSHTGVILAAITAIVAVQSVIGIRQYIASAPLGKTIESQQGIEVFGAAPDELEFVYRPTGTFGHANDFGAFLAILLPFVLLDFLEQGRRVTLFTAVLGAAALLMTLSRSAWMGLAVSAAWIYRNFKKIPVRKKYILSDKDKTTLLVAGIVAMSVFFLPRLVKSVYSFSTDEGGLGIRMQLIDLSLKLISMRPLAGWGQAMSIAAGYEFDPQGIMSQFPFPVHNGFLLVAVESGIPSLALLMLAFFFVIRRTGFFLRRHPGTTNAKISVCIAGGLGAALVSWLFQPLVGIDYAVLLMGLSALLPDYRNE